jgi:hypothetical protein
MNKVKKNKPGKPRSRTKPVSKERFPSLDDLVLDRSIPRVHVKVFPSRKKSGNKPSDQMVIELQCEV